MPLQLAKPKPKAKVTVTKQTKLPETDETEAEVIQEEEPEVDHPGDDSPTSAPLANVGFGVGMTKTTDVQYENVKFDVRINIPCGLEEIDDIFTFAKDWAQTKLNEVVQETFGE